MGTSETDFRVVFEQVPGLLLLVGADPPRYTILAVSDAYLRATMTRREEIVGRGLFEVFPDNPDEPWADGVTKLKASLSRVVKDCEADAMPVQRYPVRRPEAEGGEFVERYWSPVNAPVFGPNRELRYIVHRVEDVTDIIHLERRGEAQERLAAELWTRTQKAESEASHRAEELRAANSELESFSYSVSHDLRAPLRALTGFSAAVLKGYSERLDERGRDYLGRIHNAAVRMGRLIDDLLALSRVSRTPVSKEWVDLGAVAARVLEELRSREPARNVDAHVTQPLPTWADPVLAEAVLTNLIENAWKFTSHQPQARIDVGSRLFGDQEVFFVRDNGAGFDERFAGQLFGAFQRLHSQAEFPGTGVGLATVRRIVRRHGGEVCAEGEVGKGATFYFTLGPQPSAAKEDRLDDALAQDPTS